jgi:hypothetical protein
MVAGIISCNLDGSHDTLICSHRSGAGPSAAHLLDSRRSASRVLGPPRKSDQEIARISEFPDVMSVRGC